MCRWEAGELYLILSSEGSVLGGGWCSGEK